jgi:hypothetical protein
VAAEDTDDDHFVFGIGEAFDDPPEMALGAGQGSEFL